MLPPTANASGPVQVEYLNFAENVASVNGGVASMLLNNQLDLAALRPYRADFGGGDGRLYYNPASGMVTTNSERSYIERVVGFHTNGQPRLQRFQLTNNDATLTYDAWKLIDQTVIDIARPRLSLVGDLESRGLVYNLPNGIAHTFIQAQQIGDVTGATISMDPLRESERDRPEFKTFNFPIPVIHKDFSFGLRDILASRMGTAPLDTTMVELAAEKVAEAIEQLLLGASTSYLTGAASFTYGGATIYGYLNHPNRVTYVLTAPTAAGWEPSDFLAEVLAMMEASRAIHRFGPWMMYLGQGWAKYLDNDYKATYDSTSLRARLMMITDLEGIRIADHIPGFNVILVQMRGTNVRLVKAMNITTVQWGSHGGYQLNYKVIGSIVPQFRTDFNNSMGVIHGNVA